MADRKVLLKMMACLAVIILITILLLAVTAHVSSVNPQLVPVLTTRRMVNYTGQVCLLGRKTGNKSVDPCDRVTKACNVSRRRLVMALNYWEQLTMATNNLFSLAAFAKDWRAHAVTPFTRSAEFWGLPYIAKLSPATGYPPVFRGGTTLPLRLVYNTTKIDRLLCESYNLPPLVSFEEFLDTADREVTFLHFNFNSYGLSYPKTSEFRKRGLHFMDCTDKKRFAVSLRMLKTLNEECAKRKRPLFVFKRACCVEQKHVSTPAEIGEGCGFYSNDSFTLIPTIWRGYSSDPKRTFRQMIPEDYPIVRPNSHDDMWPVSDGVLSNASAFFRGVSGGHGIISVHMRTAKLGMLNWANRRELAWKCFKKTWKLLSELKKAHPDLSLKYFSDQGKFGSHSSEINLGKKVSKDQFKENNVHLIQYNPDEFSGIKDQGFVALVEQVAMSNASVLVLVGGGSFQEQIFARFRGNRHALSAYKVCWTKSLLVEKVYSEGHFV